ncbi:amino acid adenylation domain-containing protein [Tolypothrix campylonemoides VB511288]|nr:amino acid adenylation domain-containing protein [Tolypothrix campylonemoides VB511288]
MKNNNIQDIYQLSPMQQGMLFHTLYAPSSGVYCQQFSCTFTGYLNVEVFTAAWQQIVARHMVLRTAFIWERQDHPLQVVYRQVKLPLEIYSWIGLSGDEQQQQVQAFLESDRHRGFQLSKAPLMRLLLIQMSDDVYQFVWSYHHILLDGWSVPLVFKEVLECYEALSLGQELQLPPSRSYREYIAWLQKQNLEQACQFWRQTLQGVTAPTPLVVDRSHHSKSLQQSESSYSEEILTLSTAATTALVSFARKYQLTLNTLVQAAWALLLWRYSGETDVVFGVTVSGRSGIITGVESIVGLFINTLPMRVELKGEDTVLPKLKQIHKQQVEISQYEYTPLVQIQGWSDVPRGLPLFESIVVFENYPVDAALQQHLQKLDISDVRTIERTNYPLTLIAQPGVQLSLRFIYDTQRFDAAAIARMAGHFQTLLEGIIANPARQLSDIPLLTAAEQNQILVEWNKTESDYPKQLCIHQLFEEQVEQTPDAVAVVYEDQKLTYRELNARANKLAHHLQNLGVRPKMLVGISMERSVDLVVGSLAIFKAGGAYVPLDPTYPKERLCLMLEDAQPQLLLTQQHLLEQLPSNGTKVVCIDSDWEAIARENTTNLACQLKAGDLAYIIYTSGSTGKPKGVAVPHQAISRLLFNTNYINIQNCDRVAQVSNISFDAATFEIWGALVHGAQLIGITKDIALSPDEFATKVEQQEISIMFLTTALLNQLASVVPNAFKNIRHLLFGGEAADVHSVKAILKNGSPQRLVHVYGPTECTTFSTWYLIQDVPEGATIPIGRPIANTQTYILDRYLQPVPIGVVGELYIGGSGLAKGYLNHPELTAEKFIRNPFSFDNQARLYKTGDLVRYLLDGSIEFVGRIDNQVKISGFRVELEEIEAVLSQHPAIQYAAVIVRQDTPGDKRLVAYVVPNQNQATTVSDLRHFLKQKLPNYMIPAAFVILEMLPLTPNGKVDRQALPAPEKVRQELEATFVPPRNELERQLTEIWEDILTVKPISVTDNFFDLGGHSLLAVRLFVQIKQKFGKQLPLGTLFTSATVEALAQMLSGQENITDKQILAASHEEKQDTCLCLVPIQPLGSKPPFFCIHPANGHVLCYKALALYLGTDQPFYGLQSQGFDGTQPPLTRIEDMAALYIKQIQTIQPTGPYFIGGFSVGGVIAYEMAQQLRRQGQEVGLIVILDGGVPGSAKRSPFRERIFIHIKNFFQFGPDYLSKKLVRWSKWGKSYITDKYTSFLGRTQFLTDTDNYMFMVHKQAWETYNFQPYPGRIILFRTDDNSRDTQEAFVGFQTDPLLGWGNLITGEIDLHNIPSGHSTILKEPHVRVVAEKLKDCLEKTYRTL